MPPVFVFLELDGPTRHGLVAVGTGVCDGPAVVWIFSSPPFPDFVFLLSVCACETESERAGGTHSELVSLGGAATSLPLPVLMPPEPVFTACH